MGGVDDIARKRKRSKSFIVKTQVEVAAFFGVSRQTVGEWIIKGMPFKARAFELSAIACWLREVIWPRNSLSFDSREELEREKLRITNEKERLKLRKLAGELVSRNAAMAEIEQLFATLRARWESLPEEFGAALPPAIQADVVKDWRDKVDLMHKQLAAFQLDAS